MHTQLQHRQNYCLLNKIKGTITTKYIWTNLPNKYQKILLKIVVCQKLLMQNLSTSTTLSNAFAFVGIRVNFMQPAARLLLVL